MKATEAIDAYAKPSVCLDSHERETCDRVAEASKRWLRARAQTWVNERQDDPIGTVFSSDGTPLSTRERLKMTYRTFTFTRSGRSCKEWLVQRKYFFDMRGNMWPLFIHPKIMADKTSWTHMEAMRQLAPPARAWGHRGLEVEHFVWDRAVYGPNVRHAKEIGEAIDRHVETNLEEDCGAETRLLHWQTFSPCRIHDAHGAVKRSLVPYTCGDVLKSAWVCTASLSNGFDVLVQYIDKFLETHLEYGDWVHVDKPRLWTILGLSEDMVEMFSRLQIRFALGKLRVAEEFRNRTDTVSLVTTALLYIWRFRFCTESRWGSMGSTSKSMVAVAICGMKYYVEWLVQHTAASKYYVRGFLRLTPDVTTFFTLCALTDDPDGTVISTLLKDDRVPKQLGAIDEKIRSNLARVAGITDDVLRPLGALCARGALYIRDAAIEAAATQAAYTFEKMEDLRRPPWSLLQGDREANLNQLARGELPGEVTSRKIYRLVKVGFPMQTLLDGLHLMSMMPHSSAFIEKPHSDACSIIRRHKEYGEETLSSRSMVKHMQVHVIEDADVRKRRVLQGRIERLRRKNPNKINARHLYVTDLVQTSEESRVARADPGRPMVKAIFKHHGRLWLKMRRIDKANYENRLEAAREAKKELINDKVCALQATINACDEKKRKRENDGGGPVTAGRCKLTDQQKDDLNDFAADPAWTLQRVQQLRDEAVAPVGPPSLAHQEVLTRMKVDEAQPDIAVPDWLAVASNNREFFQKTVWRFLGGGEVLTCKFVFALQKPQMVSMCKLRTVDASEPDYRAVAPSSGGQPGDPGDHVFQYDWRGFLFTSSGGFPVACRRVHILQDVTNLQDGYILGKGKWKTFEAVRRHELPVPRPKVESEPKPWVEDYPKAVECFWENPSWTWEEETKSCGGGKGPAGVGHGGGGGGIPVADERDATEDDVAALDELWARRRELAAIAPDDMEHFSWTLRGGLWTMHHSSTGEAYDSFMGFAKSALAKRWCDNYGINKTSSWSIAAYSYADAMTFAKAWVRKLDYIFSWWHDEGADLSMVIPDAVQLAWRRPGEFEEVLLAGGVAAKISRAQQIVALGPQRPEGA
jgi:hypothetical protein